MQISYLEIFSDDSEALLYPSKDENWETGQQLTSTVIRSNFQTFDQT